MAKWFTQPKCTAFEIRKHKSISEHVIVARKEVLDADAALKLMNRISALPPNGDEMRKLGPRTRRLDVVFTCGPQQETISFFEGKIKTPSTGFYRQDNPEADRIFRDLEALLMGSYGQSLPLAKGAPQAFPDFVLTYLGEEEHEGAPATVSATTRTFLIKAKDGSEQRLTVSFGQVPPQPHPFQVGAKTYTLFTYRSPQGEDLFPDRILIDR